MADDESNFQNTFDAAILPLDLRKFKQVLGAAEYVAVEVLVSKVLRMFFKAPRPIRELVAIHAVSLPFIGGFAAAMKEEDGPTLGFEDGWGVQLTEGAKGIPAVFLAEYIVNTALAGLHAPKITAKDVLITAAAKALSRPVLSALYPMLGETFRTNLDVITELFNRQENKSYLNSDTGLDE